MSDRELRIEIKVTYLDNNEKIPIWDHIQNTALSWESAEEALGKLERAYKEITKSDDNIT